MPTGITITRRLAIGESLAVPVQGTRAIFERATLGSSFVVPEHPVALAGMIAMPDALPPGIAASSSPSLSRTSVLKYEND